MRNVFYRIIPLLKDTDECITYPFLNLDGYGDIQKRVNGVKKHFLAHRVSYAYSNNCELTPQNVIMHSCDNPSCINPKHLSLGTHDDNAKDRVLKNRSAKGINNGRYKNGFHTNESKLYRKQNPKINVSSRGLTKEQVLNVVCLINNSKLSLIEISEELNINYHTIKDISSKRVYKEWIL